MKAQRFLNAASPKEIVFVRGTTEAINLVARTFGCKNVRGGDEVLITALEHHSNIVPWQMLCDEKGAHLRVVPINDAGEVILEEYRRLLGPRTKIVALAHVSNALGTLSPVKRMVEMAHARGRPRPRGRRAGGATLAGRRPRPGLRLLRLLRTQDLRPLRRGRALRQGRAT